VFGPRDRDMLRGDWYNIVNFRDIKEFRTNSKKSLDIESKGSSEITIRIAKRE
jgi:hypothetical protein